MITVDVSDGASSVYVLVLANRILNVISMYFLLILSDLYNMRAGIGFLVVGIF